MKNNNNNNMDALDRAISSLVSSLVIQRAAKWRSAEEEEVVGGEVGDGWNKVNDEINEIEQRAKAVGTAQAVELVLEYLQEIASVTLSDHAISEIRQIAGVEDPKDLWWHSPKD